VVNAELNGHGEVGAKCGASIIRRKCAHFVLKWWGGVRFDEMWREDGIWAVGSGRKGARTEWKMENVGWDGAMDNGQRRGGYPGRRCALTRRGALIGER